MSKGRGALFALIAALALVVSGSSIAAGTRSISAPRAGGGSDTVAPAQAIVKVDATGTAGTDPWTGSGYGVVIDPSGLILVPASVVAPSSPGLAVAYSNPFLSADVSQIVISVPPAAGGLPAPAYTGKVLAADGFLDAAVVAIDGIVGAAGAPSTPVTPGSVTLPAVPLATAAPTAGQPITLGTYPDQQTSLGGTPGYTEVAGTVGQGITDPHVTSGPVRYTTSMAAPSQKPGGAILDAAGAMLGLPVWAGSAPNPATFTPTSLLAPLVTAATSGAPYTTPYVLPGTGTEAMAFKGWFTGRDPCNDTSAKQVETYPSGVTEVTSTFSWSSFTASEDAMVIWFDPEAQSLILVNPFAWDMEPAGTCFSESIHRGDGQPISDGSYAVEIHAGPTLTQVAGADTKVGGVVGGITVHGKVVDADTGNGILGAFVFVLKPGTDVQDFFNNPTQDKIASSGSSDATGAYSCAPPVEAGAYPFLVFAEGYQAVGGTITLSGDGALNDIQLVKR